MGWVIELFNDSASYIGEKMGKLKNKLYRFMYGRYGYDTLSKTLLWVYVGHILT